MRKIASILLLSFLIYACTNTEVHEVDVYDKVVNIDSLHKAIQMKKQSDSLQADSINVINSDQYITQEETILELEAELDNKNKEVDSTKKANWRLKVKISDEERIVDSLNNIHIVLRDSVVPRDSVIYRDSIIQYIRDKKGNVLKVDSGIYIFQKDSAWHNK